MLHLILAGAIAMALPQQTDTTLSVRPGGRLEVDNYAGSVTVRSWARNGVRIQATHSSQTEVEIDRAGSTISVDASARGGSPAEVHYTISVPRSFRVSVDGVNTDIDVQGIDADISVQTVEGDVTVKGVIGRVTAESISGFVTVEGVRGRVNASATNQSMRLSNIVGDLDVEAVNGSITMLNIESSSVHAETTNGGIILGTTIRDGGSYSMSTTNGTLAMGIANGTNATLEVSTFSGKLDTSFPLTVDKRRSGTYSFRLGSGGARISLEAFSGNVRLVRPEELKEIALHQSDKHKDKHKERN